MASRRRTIRDVGRVMDVLGFGEVDKVAKLRSRNELDATI